MNFMSIQPAKSFAAVPISASLEEALKALVVAHFRFKLRDSNDHVTDEATRLGLDPSVDFAVVHVRIGDRNAALVAVPSRHWRAEATMAIFHDLKARVQWQGEAVVLVPEGFIRREPRSRNAIMVASSYGTTMGLRDRMAILEHLIEFVSASLSELGGMIEHRDPVSAVLSLVVEGLLDIDLDRPILPTSVVSIGASL